MLLSGDLECLFLTFLALGAPLVYYRIRSRELETGMMFGKPNRRGVQREQSDLAAIKNGNCENNIESRLRLFNHVLDR